MSAALAILVSLAMPAAASAQEPPPVVQNTRPARWVLTAGVVVEGTQIGEDAEYYVVRTANGNVRIRKVDVARIELGGTPVVEPPPPALDEDGDEDQDEDEDGAQEKKRGQGRDAFDAGVLAFSVMYGLSFVGGAIGSAWEPEAVWLYVPLAGPLLFAWRANVSEVGWALLGMLTFFQGGAFLALIVGTILWAASPDSSAEEALRITPLVTRESVGFSATLAL